MLHVTLVSLTLALGAPPAAQKAPPSHLLQTKKEAREELRKNADWYLLIDVRAIVDDEENVDVDSPAWADIRDEIKLWVNQKGCDRALHVRCYCDREFKGTLKMFKAIQSHIEQLLRDVEVDVVCVDALVTNGPTIWVQFYKERSGR